DRPVVSCCTPNPASSRFQFGAVWIHGLEYASKPEVLSSAWNFIRPSQTCLPGIHTRWWFRHAHRPGIHTRTLRNEVNRSTTSPPFTLSRVVACRWFAPGSSGLPTQLSTAAPVRVPTAYSTANAEPFDTRPSWPPKPLFGSHSCWPRPPVLDVPLMWPMFSAAGAVMTVDPALRNPLPEVAE